MRYSPVGSVAQTIVPTDRLIWIKQGSLTYQTEKTMTRLNTGDFWLVPAWTRRAWQVQGHKPCTLVWVEFVVLNQPLPTPPAHVVKSVAPLRQSMTALMTQADSKNKTDQLCAEMQLKWLLSQVVRQCQQASRQRPTLDASAMATSAMVSPDLGLSDIITFIHAHLSDPDLLALLPERANLSAGRFRMRFKAATGQSPGRYVQALRMQRARYLLLTTDMSVKQIAIKTGFDDPLYFSRRYSAYWNCSATDDRAPSP